MNKRLFASVPFKLNKGVLIAVAAVGLGLVLLSSILTQNKTQTAEDHTLEYVSLLEQNLEEIVSEIEGVGSVKIILTLKSGEQYIASASAMSQGGSTANIPVIQGVAVLCEGGGNPVAAEKIVSLLSVVLNLGASDIYVNELSLK